MNAPFTITLGDDYSIDGTRITVRRDKNTYVYVLPKGSKRVTLYTGARPKLSLGGFKSLTVQVEGEAEVLRQLFESLT